MINVKLSTNSEAYFSTDKSTALSPPLHSLHLTIHHKRADLFKLGLDVSLLNSRDTDVLNIIFVHQERGLHDVPQLKAVRGHIKTVTCMYMHVQQGAFKVSILAY